MNQILHLPQQTESRVPSPAKQLPQQLGYRYIFIAYKTVKMGTVNLAENYEDVDRRENARRQDGSNVQSNITPFKPRKLKWLPQERIIELPMSLILRQTSYSCTISKHCKLRSRQIQVSHNRVWTYLHADPPEPFCKYHAEV